MKWASQQSTADGDDRAPGWQCGQCGQWVERQDAMAHEIKHAGQRPWRCWRCRRVITSNWCGDCREHSRPW